ncbi:MAG: hypothetical protein A2W25_06170 [candidate division Zixibacteria bacterium RBG_16_53_22]|nr:MAG: hypothetical protein A2W25_06170 [candidate division Zixibacteria bacterium RBG_16_53_22]
MNSCRLEAGLIISHYRIQGLVGHGGLGEVYLAEDLNLKRQAALKLFRLTSDSKCDPESTIEIEAQTAASLNHPNIVTIYEIFNYQGYPVISMEYVRGRRLSSLIKESNLSFNQILDFAIQLCCGLSAAHKAGIIHRDIKPDNIMVTTGDQIKIMDFGLAVRLNIACPERQESIAGTYSYMSPEQARGEEVDARSDLFSTGIVLYEMTTGQLPFKDAHQAAILYSIINEHPPPIMTFVLNAPDGFQQILDKALRKDPASRYQSADEITADLKLLRENIDKIEHEAAAVAEKLIPSIAVLPFRDMSPQRSQEYFGEGIAEEIINGLAKMKGIRVVARTSSFTFKDSSFDIKEVGRKLAVQSILEGSVRYFDNRMRITAQLIDAESGYHIWSERYDRVMGDMFAIQEEIALSIADKLEVKMEDDNTWQKVKCPTGNLDAYCLYLKGRYFWNMRTAESLGKAISYFERAIELDNEYASAYTGLSDAFRALPDYAECDPNEAYEKAKRMAIRAIEIDDTLAEAHASLAVVLNYGFDWAGAKREFQKAIDLNPEYATAHHWYALYFMYKAQFSEAIAEIRKALSLDPLSLAINRDLGTIYYYSGRYDEAIDALQKTVELDSNFSLVHELLGRVYLEKDMHEAALKEFHQEKNSNLNRRPVLDAWIGIAFTKMGRNENAEDLLKNLLEKSASAYISPYSLSLMCFVLGNEEQGFRWLEKAWQMRDSWLCEINVEPVFDNVRLKPQFVRMLTRLGITD